MSSLDVNCQALGATSVAFRPMGQLLSLFQCAMPDEESEVFSLLTPLASLLALYFRRSGLPPSLVHEVPPPATPPSKNLAPQRVCGQFEVGDPLRPAASPEPW